jgi:hypothetical protein
MIELSNSEILAKAQEIRAREGDPLLSPADSDLLFRADAIMNSRTSSGLTGLFDAVTERIIGQRASAERALEKARRDEAHAEKLFSEQAAIEKNLAQQREVLDQLKGIAKAAIAQAEPVREQAHFLSRFHHAGHFSLEQHMRQVALEIAQNRVVVEYAGLYVEQQQGVIAAAQARAKEIRKQISKL